MRRPVQRYSAAGSDDRPVPPHPGDQTLEHSLRTGTSEAQYRVLATHDHLTGIANRTSIIDDIDLTSRRRQQDQRLLALAYIDLDGFKEINDRYSHAAGDHVLKSVATRLQAQLRAGDQVARWGGDEFLVLLRDLGSGRDALTVADRLKCSVAEPILFLDQRLQLTASVGLTIFGPEEAPDLDALVRRADAAMYQVKRAGGDAVAVDDDSERTGVGPGPKRP